MTPLADLLDGQATPLTEADAAAYRADGFWAGRTIRSELTDAAKEVPDREAVVGYRTGGDPVRWTYRTLDEQAHHAATVLDHLGVGQGDAVALMLPNWVEYAALVFGINEIGGIYAGIPVAYGDNQALAILRRSKAKVVVIPRAWRSNTHLDVIRRLRAELPHLEHVVVIDDDGSDLGEGEHLWSSFADLETKSFPEPDPGRVCYLGFTSGTTGEPKGAMHTHDTLMYSTRAIAEHLGRATYGEPMVQLVASPAGHNTGFQWGIVFTVHLRGTGIHVDRWDPAWGVDVIRKEGITCFFGAPTFLQDMMRTDLAGDPDCPLTCLVIAGSNVPRNLPAQASEALGAYIAPAWGLTECGIMSSATPLEDDAVTRTDGSIFAGSEVKVVDDHGAVVPAGTVGHLLMKGPGVVLGYYDRPDATEESFTDGLWFKTGDNASVDEHGWVSLHGRSKDIIIRGGENIPVTDVESVIYDHPDVVSAAVVGYPDERLGERACAIVTLKPGRDLELPDLCEFLVDHGLSKHYLPERLIVMAEMPTTQSGKIQKFKLREMVS
jgi:cyclohexanecarboxylate-CoA ligase